MTGRRVLSWYLILFLWVVAAFTVDAAIFRDDRREILALVADRGQVAGWVWFSDKAHANLAIEPAGGCGNLLEYAFVKRDGRWITDRPARLLIEVFC